MASQRLILATLTGEAAVSVCTIFQNWRLAGDNLDPISVDRFCTDLRENALVLPVIYYCEWVDRWLMGDLVPGPGAVCGRDFAATLFTPAEATAWAGRCGKQFVEQEWFAVRLREAAADSEWMGPKLVIVSARNVFGASSTEEEIRAAAAVLPEWLKAWKKG